MLDYLNCSFSTDPVSGKGPGFQRRVQEIKLKACVKATLEFLSDHSHMRCCYLEHVSL